MKWPWQRRSEVDEALEGSAQRLRATVDDEARMEPKIRRLEKAVADNGIVDAIVHSFRVAE